MKKYGKKRSRSVRRRRYKRRYKNTALRRVRVYKEKLKGLVEVRATQSAYNTEDYTFSRFDYDNLNASIVYGINSSERWPKLYSDYEEYAVTGVKIKWVPSGQVINGQTDPS